MYETIRASLEAMFDDVIVVMSDFRKKTYQDTFLNLYEKYKPLLQEIITLCEESAHPEEVIEEIAGYVPEKAEKSAKALGSKRKQEFQMLDYNMGLVTFFTPLIGYNRNTYCEQLADKITEKWNEAFPKFHLQTSTYENIQAGFRNRLCYITTAVCESQGKSDDCYELNLLRNYRDDYLVKEAGEEALVLEYYNIAPTIVKHINHMENAKEIYQEVWDRYLNPCIHFIEEEQKENCKVVYSKMVNDLKQKYLYQH
ncbi:MAG: CFI-box-CTERM domain-containing protein [Lachnospiraceae bacterium]